MDLHRPQGRSIFSRVLIVLLGTVLLISGLLTSIFYVYSKRSQEKQTEENVLQQFAAISYHFRYEQRDALVKDLQLLSSNPILDDFIMSTAFEREVAARAAERFFLESLKYSKNYESIAFINPTGAEEIKVDWSGRVRTYRQLGTHAFFAALREGMPASISVETPHADRFGNVLFQAGISKTDPDIGKFGGAVVISRNLKDFLSYLDLLKLFDENPIWLFTPEGAVLKQPNDPRATFDPRPFLSRTFAKDPVLLMEGGNMIVYQDLYINPERPFLRLAVSIPSALLLQDMEKVLRFFLIVSVLSLAVISVLAYILAGYLSRPLSALAGAAARVSQGDLTTRVQASSSGEMQVLIDSFNRMGETLERTTVSKEYVDNIVSSMMDTLLVTDPDGAIVRVNAAACGLLEQGDEELVGRRLDQVVAGEAKAAEALLREVLDRGSVSAAELTYRTRSGRLVPMLFSASVLRDGRGRVQGIVCVAQDLSAQKRAEEQLQAYSQDLHEINEELKNFTYIVSHDLRAPLVNIKGFSEELIIGIREIGPLLEKYLDTFSPEEREKFSSVIKKDIPEALTFIGSSVNRMDSLINAILKLSRMGRRKLNPEAVDVQELVQSVLNSLAHQIGARRITVRAEGLPQAVADRTALEQIFGNLIDNAVKYLEPGRDGVIEVTAEQHPRQTVYRVSDNGRGIAREDIAKAFEIFRRVGRQDVPGEGMGLAFVKALVRLHGGRIWCESQPGVGTTFSFSLPRAAAPEPQSAE